MGGGGVVTWLLLNWAILVLCDLNIHLSVRLQFSPVILCCILHEALLKWTKTSACCPVSPVYTEAVDWSGWRSGRLLGSARVSAPRRPLWASVSTSWEWVDWVQAITLRELGINVQSLYLDPQTVNRSHDPEFSISLKPWGHWKDVISHGFCFK